MTVATVQLIYFFPYQVVNITALSTQFPLSNRRLSNSCRNSQKYTPEQVASSTGEPEIT